MQKQINDEAIEIKNPIFEKNLQALFQQDEILAARLFAMSNQEKYEVFIGKDPIDINIINKKTFKYIYENPVKDTQDMIEDMESKYKRYPIMYFYGLGNGIFYKAILHNPTHEKIVVIEPEIEIIYIVLNLVDLSIELASERLTLFYADFATYAQFFHIITNEKFNIYAKLYNLHIHTPFYDQFSDNYQIINQYITKAISQMAASRGNSIDDVLIGVGQHIANLPDMITNYAYRDLIRRRYNLMDTAIIVSSGPSLDKQLETLKTFAPYATVISVDGSYPILAQHNIAPDYVTSIERMIPTSTFFKKSHPNIDKNIYFIVASLTHRQTVKYLKKDRKLTLTMRPQSNELAFRLENYGYLGIGHSCANQAYQLARALGHKNIILIGQDLAFGKDGRSHAKGHSVPQPDENLYTKAYGGEGEVRTTYVWQLFKNQFEKDIEESNKKNIVTYDCTEGGARIEGAIEKPFLEVIKTLCNDKEPKNLPNIKKVKDSVANKELLKAYSHICKKVEIQNLVKSHIESVFLQVAPKIDEILKLRDEGKITDKIFNRLVQISKKIDKAKDFIGKSKFRPYIENILGISIFYQDLELAKISVAPSETQLEKTNKLVEWIEIHKYWLFSAAGGLNAEIETMKKASKNLTKELKKRGLIEKSNLSKSKDNFRF